jgi:hypothetical protein
MFLHESSWKRKRHARMVYQDFKSKCEHQMGERAVLLGLMLNQRRVPIENERHTLFQCQVDHAAGRRIGGHCGPVRLQLTD